MSGESPEETCHFSSNHIPVVAREDRSAGTCNYSKCFILEVKYVLDLFRYLLRTIGIDRPPGRLMSWIPLRIEQEVRDSSLLRGNDREPGRHRLNEGIAH